MIAGIYKIVNTKNKKFYVGSSNNIEKRKKQHISNLERNKHCNIFLQNAWNKYGKEAFSFEIILIVKSPTKKTLLIEEERFIIELKPQYNLGKLAGGKYIGKHLKGNKSFCNDCGENTHPGSLFCNKCSQKGERSANFGSKRSEIVKRKIRETRLLLPKEIRCRPHSDETKKKMSITRRKSRSKAVNQIDPKTNKIIKTWPSIVVAVENLKGKKHLSSQTGISRVCAKTIQPSGSVCQIALGFKWEWAF